MCNAKQGNDLKYSSHERKAKQTKLQMWVAFNDTLQAPSSQNKINVIVFNEWQGLPLVHSQNILE